MPYSFKELDTLKAADDAMSQCIREKMNDGCPQEQAIAICYNELKGEIQHNNKSMYILPIIGVIGEDFKMTHLLMHLKAIEESNQQIVKLIINSPGGFIEDAENMAKALRDSKKIFFSTNSGDVASAAVNLFLVPPKGNRTFDPSKGVFLVHMPFLDPRDGGATGTSEEIQSVAEEMKKREKKLSQEYSKATGTSANILEGFMKENTPLTEEQIQQLGFATIIKPEFKAVAYFKNDNDMTNEEVTKKVGIIESLLQKVLAFVKPKNLMVQDTTGKELDFGDAVQDPSQIAVGVAATVDGKPAEGEYPMPDGTVLVFAAGTITEIRPSVSEELEIAKQKITELEGKLAEKEREFEDFKIEANKQVNELSMEFKNFRAQFSKGDEGSHGDPPPGEGGDEPKIRKPFKAKE
jgi:ATP-dependent Clp protease protease subunit